MPFTKFVVASVVVALVGLWQAAACQAQQPDPQSPALIDTIDEGGWDYDPTYTYRPNPQAIIHQKAYARSLARSARIQSMRWFGMYNERPTASPTPFCALYSPVWQMPGGRPYAWYYRGTSSTVIVDRVH